MEEKKCPKCGAPCDIAVIMDERPQVVDSNTHVQYIFKPPAGAVWVRASERLPVNGGVDNKVIVRGLLNEQGYANHRFVAYGFRNFSPVKQEMYFEYGSKSFLTNDVEWLDESGSAAPEWDSVRLIGRVKDRFKELEEKQHDWRSFYCAWLEGRVDMLQQIKGYGRLSQEQADFIREANNRDLEGVAGREEDAVAFGEWLKHLDNGTTHYNPETKEETGSIGFSPYDCFADGTMTVEELYAKFKQQKEK